MAWANQSGSMGLKHEGNKAAKEALPAPCAIIKA